MVLLEKVALQAVCWGLSSCSCGKTGVPDLCVLERCKKVIVVDIEATTVKRCGVTEVI